MSGVFKNIWISIFLLTILSGCASNRAERLSREDGPRSIDILRGATGGTDSNKRVEDIYRARHMLAAKSNRESYTRTAENELLVEFRQHPNPLIKIFVYPHLSTRDNAPIPGYTTAISLYEKDEYALPSELLASEGRSE